MSPISRPRLLRGILLVLVALQGSLGIVSGQEGAKGLPYDTLAREDFSRPIPIVRPASFIAEIGILETADPITGAASLRGSSAGAQGYQHYFNTRPEVLPLKGGTRYRLTFSYRIVEEGDKGFEALLYSPTGADRGQWLDGLLLEGPAGKRGVAEFEATLFDFPDYRVWLNVVGRGAIVIDDISLSEGGRVIFKEDFETVDFVGGPDWVAGWATAVGGGRAIMSEGSWLSTNPASLVLPPMGTYRISFDYKILAGTTEDRALSLVLLPRPGATEVVGLRPILRNAEAEGRFSTGFCTGSVGPYQLSLISGRGAKIAVDNLVLERGRTGEGTGASYAYLEEIPFPRLGTCSMISPTEEIVAGYFEGRTWHATVEALEKRLSFFDLIVGFDTRLSGFDPDMPTRIRSRNPNTVFLPYTIAQEQHNLSRFESTRSPDPEADPGIRYYRGLSPDWYLRTSQGRLIGDSPNDILKLDISPFAPLVNGKSFLDYEVEGLKRLYFAPGLWDGIFIDDLWAQMPYYLRFQSYPGSLDIDFNRNGQKDETPAYLTRLFHDSERSFLERLGEGGAKLVMGNSGPNPEPRLAPFLNGMIFERFNIVWENPGLADSDPSELRWKRGLDDYFAMDRLAKKPRINLIEATGRLADFSLASGGRGTVLAEDYARNRFFLGTALLGDAFYEYDLVDSRSAVNWFDEFAVDADGVARESLSGKGYLGKPLGPAVETPAKAREIFKQDFEGPASFAASGTEGPRLSRTRKEVLGGARSLVIEGRAPNSESRVGHVESPASIRLKKGTTYVIEFSWKVLEDLDYDLSFSVPSEEGRGWVSLDARFAGEEGRERLPFTAGADASLQLAFTVKSVGAVAIDDIRVTEGGAGIWRRDFEKGFVLVNPYRIKARLDPAAVSGPFARSGVRRIKGSQMPAINSGEAVRAGIELGPFDAIILLADARSAR